MADNSEIRRRAKDVPSIVGAFARPRDRFESVEQGIHGQVHFESRQHRAGALMQSRPEGERQACSGELTNRANRSRCMGSSTGVGYGVSGSSGSSGMVSTGEPVAASFSAFGEQIGWGLVRLGAPWRQARGCAAVDMVEDLADEVWIGGVADDAELPAAEGAARDVDVEDALQSLSPDGGMTTRPHLCRTRSCVHVSMPFP